MTYMQIEPEFDKANEMQDYIDLKSNISQESLSDGMDEEVKIINPYFVQDETKSIERRHNYPQTLSFRCSFTSDGKFITRGLLNEKKFTQTLVINQIIPNNDLTVKPRIENNFDKKNKKITEEIKLFFCKKYYELTMISFLNFFNNSYLEKYKMDDNSNYQNYVKLNLGDYSDIIREYLNHLVDVNKNIYSFANLYNETKIFNTSFDIPSLQKAYENRIKEKIIKESNVLQIVNILFLNPFSEKNELHSIKFSNEHVIYMRKKKLTEWLLTVTLKVFLTFINIL